MMNGTRGNGFLVAPIVMALALAVMAGACGNPVGIDTPRRITTINYDSLVLADTVLPRVPGDTIYATVNEKDKVFAVTGRRPERPVWHNGKIFGAYYVTVLAARSENPYEAIALRLDGIKDTGTYAINSVYSSMKNDIDTLAPRYAARYEGPIDGLQRQFDTGLPNTSGKIRVLRISADSNFIIGTFSFTAYCPNIDSLVTVTRGAFKLTLDIR